MPSGDSTQSAFQIEPLNVFPGIYDFTFSSSTLSWIAMSKSSLM
jgi:hypothetical protein